MTNLFGLAGLAIAVTFLVATSADAQQCGRNEVFCRPAGQCMNAAAVCCASGVICPPGNLCIVDGCIAASDPRVCFELKIVCPKGSHCRSDGQCVRT